ncbi:hypothetical protein HA402_008312 [Bradysia odoriphaga]|nr:hypothetical protein HA402_008312 [Bradysia odoriphaga]
MGSASGNLTCTITKRDNSFHDDTHYMLCEIKDQIVDAPNITIASTGEDDLVNDFSIWNQTNLFFLPDGIGERFPNLFTVGSGYTKIRSLQRSNFVGFTRLRSVFVTDSDLEKIQHGTFDQLGSLVIMDLSRNKLKRISPSWFENKRLLAWLNFNSNEIEFIPRGCFDNLPKLDTVLLSYNKIWSIAAPLFLHNHVIDTLHLLFNPLVFISDTAFDGSFNRLEVSLHSTTCFRNRYPILTIPPDDWKSIVREACNGTNVLNLE